MKIEFNQDVLLIDLPDSTVGDFTIKRRARLVNLIYEPYSRQVMLTFDVVPYSSDGVRLDEQENSLFKAYRSTITARNEFIVNAQTGQVISKVGEEYIDGELNPVLDGVTYMFDYDFYDMVAHTQPIILTELIGQAIVSNIENSL